MTTELNIPKKPSKDDTFTQIENLRNNIEDGDFDWLKKMINISWCFPDTWNRTKGNIPQKKKFLRDHAACFVSQANNNWKGCLNTDPRSKQPGTYGTCEKRPLPSQVGKSQSEQPVSKPQEKSVSKSPRIFFEIK